uniref:Uncharacterized protein n=1 Tax=Onchocerca volvulus TaxID=6282 RepID=A0A8R1XUP5_ONCVO
MIMHSSICGRVYVCMYVRGLSVGLFKPGVMATPLLMVTPLQMVTPLLMIRYYRCILLLLEQRLAKK